MAWSVRTGSIRAGLLATALLGLAGAAGAGCDGGCGRARRESADAGSPPVVAGAVLASYDALAPGAKVTYAARTLARLGLASPVSGSATVAMPAGLFVNVTWETRDDLAWARRDLTMVRVTVDHLAPSTSCVVSRSVPTVVPPPQGSMDSVRVDLSIDYVCTEGRNTSSLAVPIGRVTEDGFVRIGAASGTLQAPAAPAEPPALAAIHFKPSQTALDAEATEVLDRYVRVLAADDALTFCLAFSGKEGKDRPPAAVVTKREDAVRRYLVDHGVAASRVHESVGAGQLPPAPDDLELWPREATCAPPATSKRR